MNLAITARRRGDSYQARLFWLHALRLRTSDTVASVRLEHDGVSFVDDIVVTYSEPFSDPATGQKISCDYIQCKYHVTQDGAFTKDSLLDPTFIGCKSQSMLKRLYGAYLQLSAECQTFRLIVCSSWSWHYQDVIARHLSTEGSIRPTLYRGGPTSKAGRARSELGAHLGISEEQLRRFLDTVRFDLGKSLTDVTEQLQLSLKLASMRPIDPTVSSVVYDDLAWTLHDQGRNHFDAQSFDKMIHTEALAVDPLPDYSEISICSYTQGARRPRDVQAARLDLSDLFDRRFPLSASSWSADIPARVESFLRSDTVAALPQPIHLFFDCHLSIAFLIGCLTDPKYGIRIIPAQKTRTSGYEFWPEPKDSRAGLWEITAPEVLESEQVVVGISVTNPIQSHLFPFLDQTELRPLPRILLQPSSGVGPKAVSGGDHAWQLAFGLQTLLRQRLPEACHTVHLFLSLPCALAFIIGNTIRYVTREIQVYEHDFEGRAAFRYYPSVRFPAADSNGP